MPCGCSALDGVNPNFKKNTQKVKLEQDFLELYFLLTGLCFLDGKDKQKKFDNCPSLSSNYFELKSIVSNHV